MSEKLGKNARTPTSLKNDENRLGERISAKNQLFKALFEETYAARGIKSVPRQSSADFVEVEGGVVEDKPKVWFDISSDFEEVLEKSVYFKESEWEPCSIIEPLKGVYVSQDLLSAKTGLDKTLVSRMKRTFNHDYFGEENMIVSEKPMKNRKEFLAINSEVFGELVIKLFEQSYFELSDAEKDALLKFLPGFYYPEMVYDDFEEEKRFTLMNFLLRDFEEQYISYVKQEQDEDFQELYGNVAERLYQEIYRDHDKIQLDRSDERIIDSGSVLEELMPLVKKCLAFSELMSFLDAEDFKTGENHLLLFVNMRKQGDMEWEVDNERRQQVISTIEKEFSEHDAYDEASPTFLESISDSIF